MNWEETVCPECGEAVDGTLEELQGIAKVESDGDGGFEYEGHTEVLWNAQTTIKDIEGEGDEMVFKDVLVCANGHTWASRRTDE